MTKILFIGALALGLAACSTDSCREYSDYTCAQLESQTYNVYYYDRARNSGVEREIFLGQTKGLRSCGALGYAAANDRSEERVGDWSYICCLNTDESMCAEKHR